MLIPVASASAFGEEGLVMQTVCISQTEIQAICLRSANDATFSRCYDTAMAHSRPKRYSNWHLREWMATLHVKQSALIEATGYSKTAISLLVNDRQDYSPEIVRDIAAALNIAPYELFMDPKAAMSLRALRKDAVRVVENDEQLERLERESSADRRTGTDG